MRLIHEASELASAAGPRAVVPTMGALHAGHAALIAEAVRLRERGTVASVVVTVFVNPTQFGPGEDYSRYPRTLDRDCEIAAESGADVVFAPSVEAVYPEGPPDPMAIDPATLPAVATEPKLEDAARPTHFAGVCLVVRRLFDLVAPSHAIFGEKDYQQMLVIREMVRMDGRAIEIVGHPTMRDADGLAMSSRNAYLAPVQRQRGLALSKALAEAKHHRTTAEAERAMRSILLSHQVIPDYAVVRDALTLRPIEFFGPDRPARALVAGRVGKTRLLDNCAVP